MKSTWITLFISIIVSFGLRSQNLKTKKFIDFAQGFESFYYLGKDSSLNVVGTKLTGNGKISDANVYHKINDKKWKKVLSIPSDGYGYTVALDNKNKLWGWGNNQFGVLDDSLKKLVLKPKLLNNDDWIDFDISFDKIVALKKDKSLWIWGNNKPFQYLNPTKVFENVKDFSLGNTVLFVVKNNNTLWSLGSFYSWEKEKFNYYGTGNGKFESFDIPIQVGNDKDWSKISCKSHILAIKTNGQVYSWGSNEFGQLGIGGEASVDSENEIYFLNKPSSALLTSDNKIIYDLNGNGKEVFFKVKSVFAFEANSYIVDTQNNLYICQEFYLGNDFGPNHDELKKTVNVRPDFLGKNFSKNWVKIFSDDNSSKGVGLTKNGDLFYWKNIADKKWAVPFATRIRDNEKYSNDFQ
jgi:alpha-tubulin suppressor-like RCC1 family protein